MCELGVEWSGVEWSGVEWSGVEWSGVEWSGVLRAYAHMRTYLGSSVLTGGQSVHTTYAAHNVRNQNTLCL
jgi:hypothetical protein